MFSLMAQPQDNQDNRTWEEKVADAMQQYGIAEMSDEELASIASDFDHPAQQAASFELRDRAIKADTRTTQQQYQDADESVWN